MKLRSMFVRWFILAALVLMSFGAFPQLGSAQIASSKQDSLVSVLTHAASFRWYVRLIRSDSVTMTGRVQGISPEIVRVGGEDIALVSVVKSDRRVRTRSGARKGALIGAGISFLVAIPLSEFASDPDSGGSETEGRRVLLLAPVFGGLMGFVFGELVNPGQTHWEPIWP